MEKKLKVEHETSFERLRNACENGEVDFLIELKEKGFLFPHPYELTDLACETGQLEVLKVLKDFIDLKESSCLWTAISKGHLSIVEFVFDEGVREKGMLWMAVKMGHKEIVKFLINRGVDVNGDKNYWPLSEAARLGDLEIARILLERGANVERKDLSEENPLFHAIRCSNYPFATLLIEYGADVNVRTESGFGLFHSVSNLKDVSFLLKHKCNPHVITKDNYSPLHGVVYKGNVFLVKFFIIKGFSALQKDDYDTTPLSLAVQISDLKIFEVLVDSVSDKNELSHIWKKLSFEQEEFFKVLFKNHVPFPSEFDSSRAKEIFFSALEFQAGAVLIQERENPESFFYKETLPFDMFEEIISFSRIPCLEHEWTLFLKN